MTAPLDPAQDPDRFVAAEPAAAPLDPASDPDRFSSAGRTLPELLGEGAHEDERDGMTWLFGLAGVLAFLLLVSLLVQLRH